jgi:glycine/D-amino acid oxidase-like deaminating enzyme
VLISGAEIAGATAAYWLAKGGCEVTVRHLGVYVATLPLDGETGHDLVLYNTPGRAVAIHPARGRAMAAFMFRAADDL